MGSPFCCFNFFTYSFAANVKDRSVEVVGDEEGIRPDAKDAAGAAAHLALHEEACRKS